MSAVKIPPMRLSGLEPCNISAHVGFVNVGVVKVLFVSVCS